VGIMLNLILRVRVLAGITAVLMVASLPLTQIASVHDISLAMAKTRVVKYAEKIVKSKNYDEAITECKRAFPGHNHYVRCEVKYKDRRNKNKENVFSCTEKIEVYFQPHNQGEEHIYYMRHTTRECGDTRLSIIIREKERMIANKIQPFF